MQTAKAAGIAYFNGGCVLLLKRAAGTDNGGYWALPAGTIERGETPQDAAVRELFEETGIHYTGPLEPIGNHDGEFVAFRANGPYADVTLCSEHTGAVWAPIIELPFPLHPGLAETLVSVAFDKLEPLRDKNGFVTRPRTPLSKAGIFPYAGRSIGAPPAQADQIFQVFRPPEEFTPEAVASFNLVPIIHEHTMLTGAIEDEVNTPAEEKGVEGVTGGDVYFDPDDLTLYGTTKVFSSRMDGLTRNGKKELSCGFRCSYEFTPGTWNGEKYDVIQRNLRANHVALTKQGRMGPEFAMYDHFAFDEKEYQIMADEKKVEAGAAGGEPTLSGIVALLETIAAPLAKIQEFMATMSGAAAGATTAAAADKEAVADPAAATGAATPAAAAGETPPPAMDAKEAALMRAEIKRLTTELAARPAFDSAEFVRMFGARDKLATLLSHHVGTFDHSDMTLQAVAEYGVEKLKIPNVTKGTEHAALAAYLHGRPIPTFANDSAETGAAGSKIAGYGTVKE